MKNKKSRDIPFTIGICVITAGILAGIAVGLFTSEQTGFNFVPAVTVWLLSLISGTGIISISGSLTDAEKQKKNDEEMLKLIINRVKDDKK